MNLTPYIIYALCQRLLHRLDHLLYEGYLVSRQTILAVELLVDVCNAGTPIDVAVRREILERDISPSVSWIVLGGFEGA